MKKLMEQVRLFHEVYERPIGTFPKLPDKSERELRMELLREEYADEYLLAEATNDIVAIADALGDMRANMSKLGADGKPIVREDGKILKGPNYVAPNIQEIIDRAYFAFQKLGSSG